MHPRRAQPQQTALAQSIVACRDLIASLSSALRTVTARGTVRRWLLREEEDPSETQPEGNQDEG